jgi:hypothetical protein
MFGSPPPCATGSPDSGRHLPSVRRCGERRFAGGACFSRDQQGRRAPPLGGGAEAVEAASRRLPVCRRSLRRRAGCDGAGRGPSLGCRRCSPRRTDWRLGRPPQDAVPARVPTARPPGTRPRDARRHADRMMTRPGERRWRPTPAAQRSSYAATFHGGSTADGLRGSQTAATSGDRKRLVNEGASASLPRRKRQRPGVVRRGWTGGHCRSSPKSSWTASRYRRSWVGRSFSGVLGHGSSDRADIVSLIIDSLQELRQCRPVALSEESLVELAVASRALDGR